MKTILLIITVLAIMLLLPSCGGGKPKYTTKVSRPKYHHSWFHHKTDRGTSRIKKVKMQN
jgi:hypothetical protein